MGKGDANMVTPKTICLFAIAIASLSMIPSRSEACGKSELVGGVKSVVVTEAPVDPKTGKPGEGRIAFRIDVSIDGSVEEITLYSPQRPGEVRSTITSNFENGRLIRQTEVSGDQTVSTSTCSYDTQGRVAQTRIQSTNGERSIVETYEYGSRFIKRRSLVWGRWYVKNQTLDSLGRVIKEVEVDEEKSSIVQTTESAYRSDREERCTITAKDSRRACSTTVRDSHGNEIEFVAEGLNRKTSWQYDSSGNWILKRTATIGPPHTPNLELTVQRKIEYW